MNNTQIEDFCQRFLADRHSAVLMADQLSSYGFDFASFQKNYRDYMELEQSERKFDIESEYRVPDGRIEYNILIKKRA